MTEVLAVPMALRDLAGAPAAAVERQRSAQPARAFEAIRPAVAHLQR
jgi:hypothetical protein